jgi:glyoxylase-like metal-dependent hydrolase (beta-lactamase superfamily II)
MFVLFQVGRAHQRTSQPQEIAPGVYCLEVGKGITRSNVYFVRSGSSWALIDTASANCGRVIQEATESLFGANTRPAAILLTHVHPDHAGSTLELARRWGCLAYVHPDELPFATADISNFFSTYKDYTTSSGRWTPPPLDRWVILPMVRAMPRRRRESMLSDSSFKDVARAFDPGTGVPGLPDWECIPTPGHVSFFRPGDRVLIAGDAVVTVNLNSLWGFLLWGFGRSKQRLSGPPWYTTWSWRAARQSVAPLARLEPLMLASGHGLPMSGTGTT